MLERNVEHLETPCLFCNLLDNGNGFGTASHMLSIKSTG
jgi:hypothetical protein